VWRRSPTLILGALWFSAEAAGGSAAAGPLSIDPWPVQALQARPGQVGPGTVKESEPAQTNEFDLAAAETLCQELLASAAVPGFAVALVRRAGSDYLNFGFTQLLPSGDAQLSLVDEHTLFEIGSISKVFTGLLLAEAVVSGRANLDDPLGAHLPEGWSAPAFEGPQGSEPIRLWHLATHTAALPRLPAGILNADPNDPYRDFDSAALQRSLSAIKLRRMPGSQYAYSNLGAGVLGYCLAGDRKALDQAYRERLLVPLGLLDTGIFLSAEQQARFSQGHSEGGREVGPWAMDALAGAGALRSSTHDLARLLRIELDVEGWLAQATTAASADAAQAADGAASVARERAARALLLAREQRWADPQKPDALALGLGWHFNPAAGTRWHNGQTGGYHSFLALHEQSGSAVAILANASTPLVDRLGGSLLELLQGLPVESLGLEAHIALDASAWQPLLGEYSLGFLKTLRVFELPAGLFCQMTGGEVQRLYPRSPSEFFLRSEPATLRFLLVDGAPCTELLLIQGSTETRGKRK
jgi:CubicO group peptidase (beta-lactamase class C family)